MITLGNKLIVNFLQKRGGLPVADNYGYLNRYGIEIDLGDVNYIPNIIFKGKRMRFQIDHIEDSQVIIKKNNTLISSGKISRYGILTPHTYEFKAKVDNNILYTNIELNIKENTKCLGSKIWTMINYFPYAKVDGKLINFTQKPIHHPKKETWWIPILTTNFKTMFYPKLKFIPKEVLFFDSKGHKLKIIGNTNPPIYFSIIREGLKTIELVWGWAFNGIKKGIYKGEMIFEYN